MTHRGGRDRARIGRAPFAEPAAGAGTTRAGVVLRRPEISWSGETSRKVANRIVAMFRQGTFEEIEAQKTIRSKDSFCLKRMPRRADARRQRG
jgi:hypothetical protein